MTRKSMLHEGYTDGILGLDPDEDLDFSGSGYETGWLLGMPIAKRA